jgi:hypothetical protein
MATREMDIHGRAFTERDKKLLDLLLRPDGASLERINRAIAKKAFAHSYSWDSARLAERLGGTSWSSGEGGTRRFGIRLPSGETRRLADLPARQAPQARDLAFGAPKRTGS